VALKIGAPGVPDFYQGTELWDFSLVDPDNRRPVDYARRQALLSELDASVAAHGPGEVAARLMADPGDDRLKLFATSTLLRFRRSHLAIFRCGGYHPLTVEGARRDHLFAFSRTLGDQQVIVVVPRLLATLVPEPDVPPLTERVWADTRIELPEGASAGFLHVLTQQRISTHEIAGKATLSVADVFAEFPIAFLAVP
jgi:(1->4)-alpha-D-glucan 1-alpha-D-glucosylmutase